MIIFQSYLIFNLIHPLNRILLNSNCAICQFLRDLWELGMYTAEMRFAVKKCCLLKWETNDSRIAKSRSQFQNQSLAVQSARQPLRITIPLWQVSLLNIRICLDCISSQRCSAVWTDIIRDLARLPDVLRTSGGTLSPRLISTRSYNPLPSGIFRTLLGWKQTLHHRKCLYILRRTGNCIFLFIR